MMNTEVRTCNDCGLAYYAAKGHECADWTKNRKGLTLETSHDLVRGVIVICKLCRRAEPELDHSCIPLPLDKQMTAAEINWVESSLPIPGIPTQPALESGGEWRVEREPIHGYRIVGVTGRNIVGNIYREEDAERIVSDHRAVQAIRQAINQPDAIERIREILSC